MDRLMSIITASRDSTRYSPAPIYKDPAFRIGQYFHSAAEHGSEHVVVFSQGPHGRVEERPANVELDVFGALRLQRHVPFSGHDAADAATVQIAATSANAAAATAADTTNIENPLLDGEGLQRGQGRPLYQGGEIRVPYFESFKSRGREWVGVGVWRGEGERGRNDRRGPDNLVPSGEAECVYQ